MDSIIYKIFNKLLIFFKCILKKTNNKEYIYSNVDNNRWAYISYITDPLFRSNDEVYMSGHQNRQETLIIVEIFKELGYNFVVNNHRSKKNYNISFDLIFGLEPSFESIASLNPNANKIYYATGAYWKHQNKMIVQRTDDINKKKKSNIPYYRTIKGHNSSEIADLIIQIGSKYTIETYPEYIKEKILPIHQTSNEVINFDFTKKLNNTNNKNYIWFGSSGSVLKGLDLVLDCFFQQKDYELYIVGAIDSEFHLAYDSIINESPNIHSYGFLNVNSQEFLDIIYKCNFLIFPSVSEGGCPGSVINLMKLGIIPIVSKYAAPEEIDELGYLLNDFSVESIKQSINWTEKLSNEEIINLSIKNREYILSNYNASNFKSELKDRILFQIKKYDAYRFEKVN